MLDSMCNQECLIKIELQLKSIEMIIIIDINSINNWMLLNVIKFYDGNSIKKFLQTK